MHTFTSSRKQNQRKACMTVHTGGLDFIGSGIVMEIHCRFYEPPIYTGMPTLQKGLQYFLGWKGVFWMKKTVFSPKVQYTCVIINFKKTQYFPRSCSILEVFSSKNSTKYCKKSNTWHLCLQYVIILVQCIFFGLFLKIIFKYIFYQFFPPTGTANIHASRFNYVKAKV